MLVMAGGLALTLIAYQLALRWRRTPLLSAAYEAHTARMQRNTFFGSALFGVGWGPSGVCPARPSPASARATSTCCGRCRPRGRRLAAGRIRGAGGRGRLAGRLSRGAPGAAAPAARGVRPRAAANPQQPIRDARAPAARAQHACSRSIATAVALQLDAPSAAWPRDCNAHGAGRAGAAPATSSIASSSESDSRPLQRVGGAPAQRAETLADGAAEVAPERGRRAQRQPGRGGIDRQSGRRRRSPRPCRGAPASRRVSGGTGRRPSGRRARAAWRARRPRAKACRSSSSVHRGARAFSTSARKASIAALARVIGELLAVRACGRSAARASSASATSRRPASSRAARSRSTKAATERSGAWRAGSSRGRGCRRAGARRRRRAPPRRSAPCACSAKSASSAPHSASREPASRTKFSTGSTGLPQEARISTSQRNLASTGSRASMTNSAASTSSSARSTLASCSKACRRQRVARRRGCAVAASCRKRSGPST